MFCHDYQLGTYKSFYTRFIQSHNPPSTLKGKNSDAKSPAPIIEEGKMNMTVSVLLRCRQPLSTNADTIASYINILKDWVYQARLAGGSIKSFKSIDIISDDIRTLKSKLLPCFVFRCNSIIKTTLQTTNNLQQKSQFLEKLDKIFLHLKNLPN